MDETALALFKKGSGKGSRVSTVGSEAGNQDEQKRKAFQRNQILRGAPPHVQAKWQHICSLKGRDRNKNAEKTKFTNLLLADVKFEDTYWQDETIDSYSHSHDRTGVWQLRSLVDTQHGGGADGRKAVDDAIAAGQICIQS